MRKIASAVVVALLAGTAGAAADEAADSAARQIIISADFADHGCPDLRVHMAKLVRFVARSGADVERLTSRYFNDEDRELRATLQRLRRNPSEMCRAIWQHVSRMDAPTE